MAKKCMTDVDLYDDVPFCQGSKSLPGVRDHFYFVPKRDCTLIPKPEGFAAKTLDQVAVITKNIVLAADKMWMRVDLVPNESEPSSEQQGSFGAFTFLNKITLVMPGTEQKVTGLISCMNNDDVIILVPQRDGKCRLFGNAAFHVDIKPSQAWGKAVTDANTTTIEVSVTDEFATPFYEGDFETADGVMSGKTDELKAGTDPSES